MQTSELQMLRTSERAGFKKCPWAWERAYVDGLQPTQGNLGALWFGTGIHLALAEWYIPGDVRGTNPVVTWEKYCDDEYKTVKSIRDDGEAEWIDAKKLGTAMLEGYLAEYGYDDDWEIIAPEQRFSAIIPHPETGKPIVNYVGTFDGVLRQKSTGYIYLMDHKTAGVIKTNHLFNDEQAGSYLTVAEHSLREQGLIGKKEKIRGILYNFLRKTIPTDDRPKNPQGLYTNKPNKIHYVKQFTEAFDDTVDIESGLEWNKLSLAKLQAIAEEEDIVVYGEVSKNQGSPVFHREIVRRTKAEKKRMIKRIGEEAMVMSMSRHAGLPILKSPGEHCSWCQFKDLCAIDEQAGDTEDFIKYTYKVVDPYLDHRDGAENSKTSLANNKKAGV